MEGCKERAKYVTSYDGVPAKIYLNPNSGQKSIKL